MAKNTHPAPTPLPKYRTVDEAMGAVTKNVFAREVVKLLSTEFRGLMLTVPRSAIEAAIEAVRNNFVNMSTELTKRCEHDKFLEEALIYMAYEVVHDNESANDDDDDDDDERKKSYTRLTTR